MDAVASESSLHEEVLMADLTEQQKWSYRRYNITLAIFPFIIWFVVTNLLADLWVGRLNQFGFSGLTSSYYMSARGSLAILVVGIVLHAHVRNKLDVEYGNRLEVVKTNKVTRSLRD
jgi:putative solute:sodium symporter small subunit